MASGSADELTCWLHAVLVLLISDGLMCGVTGVSWVLQRLVLRGYIDWNRSGWILQNVSIYQA